jgi:hypothetical protein
MRRNHADYAADWTGLGVHDDWTAWQQAVIDEPNFPETKIAFVVNVRDEQSYLVHVRNQQDVG